MVLERFSLEGKVAVVTGAGRGIGRTMALTLAQAGAEVAAIARTEAEIEETADLIRKIGRRGLAVPTNVTDSRAVNRMVDRVTTDLGSVDILVNNAGGELGVSKAAVDVSDEEWAQALSTNLTGTFYCARAAGQLMQQRRWGRVINVACIYGIRGSINHVAWAAAKGGVLQLTQALALEWAKMGVTVNALGVGWFEGQQALQDQSERVESLKRAIPLARFGQPMHLQAALVYLASDASRYLTGQAIWLDGGVLCR